MDGAVLMSETLQQVFILLSQPLLTQSARFDSARRSVLELPVHELSKQADEPTELLAVQSSAWRDAVEYV